MKNYLKISLAVFIVLFLFFLVRNCAVKKDYSAESYRLERIVNLFLNRQGISSKYITEENYTQKQSGALKVDYIQKKYRFTGDIGLSKVIDKLEKEIVRNNYSVLGKKISRIGEETTASIELGKNNIPLFYLEIRASAKSKVSVAGKKGKIALVLDDWGYNMRNEDVLGRIKKPLTISVLPNLPYSTKIAALARGEGHEVILHLPLESYEHKNMEQNTICGDMSKDEITNILSADFMSVPKAAGVSNHMGSKMTEDERVMRIIFAAMKEKNIFFLDSLVTKKTVCENLAKEAGIKFAQRDVFLDNVNEKSYIRKQLTELVNLAYASERPVIGIGHDRPRTMEVLEEEMKNLTEQGIEFIYLSEAAK